jgi:prepilin-type N-terminal cleavage/methylation domain-containing protein
VTFYSNPNDEICQFWPPKSAQITDSASLSKMDTRLHQVGPEMRTDSHIHGGEKRMKSNRGFSLLELLIVVAIILIIATIAIPSLLRSRQAAQESSAVADVRTINTAEVTYLSSNQGNYGDITSLVSQGLLDNRFGGAVSGYNFVVTASGTDYTVTATPTSTNSGRYGYFSLPDAVIRYQTGTSTTCNPCFPPNASGQPVG